jgi:xylulokinase
MYLAGLDIGTTGAKAVITDENGYVVSQGSAKYSVLTPRHAWAEQWPDVWVKGAIQALNECCESLGTSKYRIASIAVSGLYGGSGIPVDREMNPIRPCIIWMDRRAAAETDWVKQQVPKETLLEVTGNYVDSYYGFTKMLWIQNHERDVWDKTRYFVTPKDFLIYHMTGINSIDFSSAGNIGGVFDIRNKKWSADMISVLGLDTNKLPEPIVSSTTIIGKITGIFSSLSGLPAGIPVICGGIDAPVAQLSGGCIYRREHVAMVGTSMCWGFLHAGEHVSEGLVSFPYVVDEQNTVYTFGGGATAGAVPEWLAKLFLTETLSESEIFEAFETQIEEIPPGSDGIVVLPYFMGERSPVWDPDARGVIFGLTLSHKKEHLFRASLESVAFSLRHNMEYAQETKIQLEDTCSIVGGAARSDNWVQIFADVTGFSFRKTIGNVEAPLGDAFLAGLGVGAIAHPKEIKKWVTYEREIKPDKKNAQLYEPYYKLYKDLYPSTSALMKRISRQFADA